MQGTENLAVVIANLIHRPQPNPLDRRQHWEDLLTACRLLEAAGRMPPAIVFARKVGLLSMLADPSSQELYNREWHEQFKALDRAIEQSDKPCPRLEQQRAALSAEFDIAADKVLADTMRAYGEHEMADLFETRRAEFDRCCDAGLAESGNREEIREDA
ncbi:MAG: hypothetical protein IT445_07440 [Phycisphaeraceae bacterium]|nr:hypothetical protein [Phycisphaeraceae bacterium]